MINNFRFILLACLLLIVSCDSNSIPPNENSNTSMSADLVLYNGEIYTLESDQPWAQAVAVKGDEIIYVGDNEGVKSWIGQATIKQNLAGQMLLPGFIDSHAHPVAGGAYVRSLSLDTYATPQIWLDQVSSYAAENPQQEILFGYGFLASAFGEKGPTSEMLDSVVNDRPVILMDEGFHSAWANSRAMQLLGINRDTKDPAPGFSYYKRDKDGNATGFLLEATASQAIKQLAIITAKSVALGTQDVIQIMNSYGITVVFDAGALDVESLQIDVLEQMASKGNLTIRLIGSHMVASVDGLDTAVERSIHKKSQTKDSIFHINSLKIMDDGTIEGKTAGMFEDYQDDPGNRGETIFTQQQLTDLVVKASANNLDIHIHALGERTIFEALNAIEKSQTLNPESTTRYTICHLQVMTDSDIQRMADLKVIAQSTPLWASYDEYGKAFVSDDQFQRYFRFNSLKKAGVKLTFGSDYPATGAGVLGMSPIFNIEIGHTRQTAGQPQAPIQPNKNERLDLETLIKGYTINAAYQLRMEDQIGSIKVGKKADMIVLDQNLFKVEPYKIHQVKVLQTYLGGKRVFAR